MSDEVYTHGVWTVKPGLDEDFTKAWRDFAVTSAREFPGASAVLLRDRDATNRFYSFGPFSSIEQVASWRGSETFRSRIGAIRQLLESFEAHTLDKVAESRTSA